MYIYIQALLLKSYKSTNGRMIGWKSLGDSILRSPMVLMIDIFGWSCLFFRENINRLLLGLIKDVSA